MIRHVLTTKAIILVVLAAMQGLFLAALPMVNYWRTDIEALLSDRLGATVTISEIGARASWTGPYLEALDLVIQKDAGSLEVRRVQMLLDLPNTIASMQPVIGQLILDEGELIQRGSDGSGISDPTEWAGLLDQIRNVMQPIGAFQIHNFDVLLGEFSLKRLSIDITPDVGVLAQARVVTEEISVPIDIDWRYPKTTTDAHDLRVQTRLRQALVPMLGLDESTATVDAIAWLNIRSGAPVDGTVRVTGLADQDQGMTGDLSARFELPGLSKIQASFESLQFRAPGLRIAGSGGGLTYDGKRLTALIPAIDFDGGLMGEFIRDSDPEPQLYRLLSMNQPRLSAKQVQLDWILETSPQVAATIDAFEIQAARSIPEIGPVSGQLYLDGSRGWFDFVAKSATFSLPEIFPTPWTEQSLASAGVILNKPVDETDFLAMMERLSGTTHQVYSGVCVLRETWCAVKVVRTDVTFRQLSMSERLHYWQTGEPLDKAGGYGIQGLAARFVESIHGSYTNVVGLPLVELEALLNDAS